MNLPVPKTRRQLILEIACINRFGASYLALQGLGIEASRTSTGDGYLGLDPWPAASPDY